MSQNDRKDSTASRVSGDLRDALEALKPFREVPMELSIELGRGRMKLKDLLKLRYHSIFELDKPAGSKLTVLVNGVPLGTGEPMVVENRMGIRIDEISEPEN